MMMQAKRDAGYEFISVLSSRMQLAAEQLLAPHQREALCWLLQRCDKVGDDGDILRSRMASGLHSISCSSGGAPKDSAGSTLFPNGAVLAHTMGLGKTVTMISFLFVMDLWTRAHALIDKYCSARSSFQQDSEEIRPFSLLVVPKSTVMQWEEELLKWWGLWSEAVLSHDQQSATCSSSEKEGSCCNSGGEKVTLFHDFREKLRMKIAVTHLRSMENTGTAEKRVALREAVNSTQRRVRFVLVTFRQLISCHSDLKAAEFLVLDEAHRLQNPQSQLFEVLASIPTPYRYALTGYPMQNSVLEFICLLQFVLRFREDHLMDVDGKPHTDEMSNVATLRHDRKATNWDLLRLSVLRAPELLAESVSKTAAATETEEGVEMDMLFLNGFQRLVEPFVHRRGTQLLREILGVELVELDIFVAATKMQAQLYNAISLSAPFPSSEYQARGSTKGETDGKRERNPSTFTGFAKYCQLMLVCNHPALAVQPQEIAGTVRAAEQEGGKGKLGKRNTDSGDDSELDQVEGDAINEVVQCYGKCRDVCVESEIDATIEEGLFKASARSDNVVARVLGDEKVKNSFWDPATGMPKASGSAKMLTALRLIKSILDVHSEKIILFSQSVKTLYCIANLLEQDCSMKKNVEFAMFWGGLRFSERIEVLKVFSGSQCRVLLCSTKAGGVGLNLSCASRVIFFDCSWNPSHEQQAMFRCYRIGQKRPVVVYRLLTLDSVEQIVWETQAEKDHLMKSLFFDNGHSSFVTVSRAQNEQRNELLEGVAASSFNLSSPMSVSSLSAQGIYVYETLKKNALEAELEEELLFLPEMQSLLMATELQQVNSVVPVRFFAQCGKENNTARKEEENFPPEVLLHELCKVLVESGATNLPDGKASVEISRKRYSWAKVRALLAQLEASRMPRSTPANLLPVTSVEEAEKLATQERPEGAKRGKDGVVVPYHSLVDMLLDAFH